MHRQPYRRQVRRPEGKAVTSKIDKAKLPTHIELSAREYGLSKDSVVLLEQIRTLDKTRLKERIGQVSADKMRKINEALLVSLGFYG